MIFILFGAIVSEARTVHCEANEIVKVELILPLADGEWGEIKGSPMILIEGTAFFLESTQILGYWNETRDGVWRLDFSALTEDKDTLAIRASTRNGRGILDFEYKGIRMKGRPFYCRQN